MEVIDGRGKHKLVLKANNKTKVKAWILANPGRFIKDCCEGTGLTYKTVKRHILAVQAEENNK